MPGVKCCILNCSTIAKQGKSLFKFPKSNDELLEKWKEEIPTASLEKINLKLHPVICEDHFESFFLKDIEHADGKMKKILAPFAYPSIFPEEQDSLELNDEIEKETVELSNHAKNCRFCLLSIAAHDQYTKLNVGLVRQFEILTNFKLRKDKVYSKMVCQKCADDLKYFTLLKTKFLKNQKKLHAIFEAFENSEKKTKLTRKDENETELNLEFKSELESGEIKAEEDDFENHEQSEEIQTIEQKQEEEHETINYIEECTSMTPALEIQVLSKTEESPTKEKYPKTLCPDCGLSISKQHIKVHRDRKHLNLKRFTCDYCGREFYLLRGLRDHMKAQHIKQKDVSCPLCNKMFPTTSNMKQHYRIKHENKMSAYCELCQRAFTSSELYKCHVRSKHTGERPFKCDLCESAFYSNVERKRHKIHCHSEPVNCSICGKVCSSSLSLKRHIRTKHEELRYSCSYCGKKFADNFNCKYHEKSHSGIKDFECSYCDKKFTHSANLKMHIRTIHMKIKIKCEIPGCRSQFVRKDFYRNHVLTNHKDIGSDRFKELLERIATMQMPEIDIKNTNLLQ